MGNIELKLNISRLDLILAGSVVLIALILFIGFIVWLVKSSRQNKALKSIDMRLAQNAKSDESKGRDKASHTVREYVYIDNSGNKTVRKEQIHEEESSADEMKNSAQEITEAKKEDIVMNEEGSDSHEVQSKPIKETLNDSKSSIESEFEEDLEVDVMAEIQKMLKTTESYQMPKLNKDEYNVGKSGKTYSREDIENIIKD